MSRAIRVWVAVMAVVGLGTTGCSHMNNTEKGVGIGGALGTATGLAIGAATGNPKTGAVVGGLAGAGLGGLVGNDIDKKEEKERAVQQATAVSQQAQAQLGMMDVIDLSQKGVHADVIVQQIRDTGSTFNLSTADISHLTACQVPSQVIHAMQTSRPRTVVATPPPVQRVVVHEPVYVGPPPVYYYPPPPPPGIRIYGRWR